MNNGQNKDQHIGIAIMCNKMNFANRLLNQNIRYQGFVGMCINRIAHI